MKLVHFSATPLSFDPERRYGTFGEGLFKPDGLWLSNEDGYGWKDWCAKTGYETQRLAHSQEFRLTDDSNVLIINDTQDFLDFESKYGIAQSFLMKRFVEIDWTKVKADYDGIIIPQYFWSFKLDHMWYYGWDCGSGCIWNLKAVEPIQLSK